MCNASGLSPAPSIKAERLPRTADKTLFTIPALTSTVPTFIEDFWSNEILKKGKKRSFSVSFVFRGSTCQSFVLLQRDL